MRLSVPLCTLHLADRLRRLWVLRVQWDGEGFTVFYRRHSTVHFFFSFLTVVIFLLEVE